LWRPMLWLSHPGVVAQTHYDTQHNVFVQVQGTKRFLLFPPGTELYSYPNIHRSYRQSQVPLEMNRSTHPSDSSPTGTTTSGSTGGSASLHPFYLVHPSNVTAYEVLVNPGDILYIPPYWQHRVESYTLSLSLSILSPSYVEASLSEIYWENVPFGKFQANRSLKSRAVAHYLSKLFNVMRYRNRDFSESIESSKVEKGEELNAHAKGGFESFPMPLKEFAQQLFETRFAPLQTQHRALPACWAFADGSSTHTDSKPEGGTKDKSEAEAADALLEENSALFDLATNNIAEMMAAIKAKDAIKNIFLKDYVEQLVRWAVGPQFTAYFIKECLR
jgi:hypothetical protein